MESNFLDQFKGGAFNNNETNNHGSGGGHDGREGAQSASTQNPARKNEVDLFTNTEKRSGSEILYRVLVDEVPEMKVSIRDEAYNGMGTQLQDYSAIIIPPSDFKDTLLTKITNDPFVFFFTNPYQDDLGQKLMACGHLSEDTYWRLKKRFEMKGAYSQRSMNPESPVGNSGIQPLSDDEIKDILRVKVREIYAEYKKFIEKKSL